MNASDMPSAVNLSGEDLQRYINIKATLELERTLYPSDYDAIAMLSIQIGLLHDALHILRDKGVVLITHTNHGEVSKSNPASEIAAKANTAIKGYMEQLLMTPRAKAIANKPVDVIEDDPLTELLRSRSEQRGA